MIVCNKKLLFVLLPLLLLVSCQRQELELPAVPLLTDNEWWGVVNTVYLRLNSEIGDEGVATSTLRLGDLVKITEIRTYYDNSQKMWIDYYYVNSDRDKGWVSSLYLNIYPLKETALTAQKYIQIAP